MAPRCDRVLIDGPRRLGVKLLIVMRVRNAPGVKTSLTGLKLIPSKGLKDRTRFQEEKRASPGTRDTSRSSQSRTLNTSDIIRWILVDEDGSEAAPSDGLMFTNVYLYS